MELLILLGALLFSFPVPKLSEGDFMNSWLRRRLLEKNQNVLLAITGGTGSGKSYWALSVCWTYYKVILKKPFPIENVVFSPLELIQRLKYFEKEGLTGELLLPDEWGVNNSSHDWQTKTQKLLGYVMQSFRSMNIGLVFTLPVLSMLNKTTRLLLHGHFITAGVDYSQNKAKVKPLFHQLNQTTGKSFWKYPKVVINGMRHKLKRLEVSLPPKELIDAYEIKKAQFVGEGLSQVELELLKEKEKMKKQMEKELLTKPQLEAYKLDLKGYTQKEIAKKLGVSAPAIWERLQQVKKKGYSTQELKNWIEEKGEEGD